ncbi:hypothetical protein [uncultured Lactobacillus sp.]|uniref:hypothetical protein n=1 Tax=uncultured Lactobacillus sp. TaxID=153152 RepID=UPI00272C769B|nr:hypothetical protein [uncultured Lactobacillus sp.]
MILGKNTFGLLSILVKSSITPFNELALASQKLKHIHILFNKKIIITPEAKKPKAALNDLTQLQVALTYLAS